MRGKFKFGHNIVLRGFVAWVLTLVLPMLLFFLFLYIQYGDNVTQFLSGEADPLRNYGNSLLEQVTRVVNIWAAEEPDYDNLEPLKQQLSFVKPESEIRAEDTLVMVRKGDEIKPLYDLDNQALEKLKEDFKDIDISYLPEYGEFKEDTNENLVIQTGYVILRQIDFRYQDYEEGSLYIIYKYSNIPFQVMKTLGNNLLGVVVVMMGVNILFAYFIIKKSSRPVENIMTVMQSYKNDDFSKRLPELDERKLLYTINSAINDMAETLEENQKIREDIEAKRVEFLARISHDTKTPLASIRAHAEALRDGYVVDDEKRKKYVNNIISKVYSLDNMINELNVYSDLEVGANQYNFGSININNYLQDVIDELKYDFDVKLDYIANKSDHHVVIDIQRFHRVMMNLINNSVKYGAKEDLEIKVQLGFENNCAVISVRDNGKGIEIGDPNDLMESFKRGDTSRDPNNSGSGLGLAIVKTIVDKHQGRINIESEAGKYFLVEIRLPIEED